MLGVDGDGAAAVTMDAQRAARILGVRPDCDLATARRAYREAALKAHPDRSGGAAASEREMQLVNEAWLVLRTHLEAPLKRESEPPIRPRARPPRPRPPNYGECRECGWQPALYTRLCRPRNEGMRPRLDVLDGCYCRNCGIARARDCAATTLRTAWRGPAIVFWPIAAMRNVSALRAFAALEAPVGRARGVSAPWDRPAAPVDPYGASFSAIVLAGAGALAVLSILVLLTFGVVRLAPDLRVPEPSDGPSPTLPGNPTRTVTVTTTQASGSTAVR